MAIEIHRPELEALIRQYLSRSQPSNEDLLMEAFSMNSGFETNFEDTGESLVRAMQACPVKEIDRLVCA